MHEIDLLAERAAAGDYDAMCDLVHELAPRLRGFLVKRGVPSTEVEERSQEIWLKVAAEITASYNSRRDTGFVPWMLAVARNAVNDHWRKRRGAQPLSDVQVSSDHARELARCDLVASAMEALTDEQRRLVHLRYWEHLNVQEIADHLGQPYASVKARVHRAQVALTNEIKRLNDGSVSFD